jgi:uncharacterized protein (TIGR02996 family)
VSLAHALAVLADDPVTALRSLLLCWQETHAPEVADVIDKLDARLSAGREAPAAPTRGEDSAWAAIASKQDPVDVGRLLAVPPHPNPSRERTRLEQIARSHGNDARLSGALVRRVAETPYPSSYFWWAAQAMFKRLADPRAVPVLQAAARDWPKGGGARGAFKETVATLAQQVERAVAKQAPLSDEDRAIVAKLQRAVKTLPKGVPAVVKPAARRSVARAGTKQATVPSESTLAVLVERWRANRHPALAEAIAKLSPRIERPALPIKPAPTALNAWLVCQRAQDPADAGRLVAALRIGTVKQIIERLDVLTEAAEDHPDPRFADAAMAILVDQPFTSGSTRRLYTAACNLLAATADPRTAARLEELQRTRMPGKGAEGGVDFRDFFAAKIARALQTAREVDACTDPGRDDRAAIAAATKLLGVSHEAKARDDAAFLAAIWAAPDDDDVRQVYADWLQEQGRPHGEFIVLQLVRANGKPSAEAIRRENQLVKEHFKEFLGPLLPAVQRRNLRFERGFVVHAEIPDKRSPQITDLSTHPAWSTLKTFYAWTTARKLHKALIAHLKKLGARSIAR